MQYGHNGPTNCATIDKASSKSTRLSENDLKASKANAALAQPCDFLLRLADASRNLDSTDLRDYS